MRRWTLFAVGLAASVALTALLWWAGIPGGALLLLFPFFWLGKGTFGSTGETDQGQATRRKCPACGWEPSDASDRFCPRDGTALT